jgi:hypothetical protein
MNSFARWLFKYSMLSIALGGLIVLLVVIQNRIAPPKGIIQWEDYEHAVAFCGEQYDGLITVGDVTISGGRNYHMVINKGHEEDPQVRHLKVLALTECDKLMRGK